MSYGYYAVSCADGVEGSLTKELKDFFFIGTDGGDRRANRGNECSRERHGRVVSLWFFSVYADGVTRGGREKRKRW